MTAADSDLSEENLNEYETAFSMLLEKALERFKPDLIHSHHLWILTSLTRRLFPHIPLVTTCHGSDLRQFQNCKHLREKVLEGCREINFVMALSQAQKDEIVRLYDIAADKIIVVGAGYNDTLFYPTRKPDPDPVQLVYAGKLSNAKGVPWFLRALASIGFPELQLRRLQSEERRAHTGGGAHRVDPHTDPSKCIGCSICASCIACMISC